MKADTRPLNLPQTFSQLFGEIIKGFFRSFFKNSFKAILATAFALTIPQLVNYLDTNNLIDGDFIDFLRDFAISPENMIKGCLLSSMAVITVFSFFDKVWFVGIFKSITRFFSVAISYLNPIRNTATSSFAWGVTAGMLVGNYLDNPILAITLIFSSFLVGAVPEASGTIYFCRFFWNRFYQTTVLNSGLKPADEFIRGTSPGLALAGLLKVGDAETQSYLIIGAVLMLFMIIGFFRQKKGSQS